MGYLEIGYQAKPYADKLGVPMFIFSGVGMAINYYFPNLIHPFLLNGMCWILFASAIGMLVLCLTHRSGPHVVVGDECPKCQSPVEYTGIKCSKDDCNYRVGFD